MRNILTLNINGLYYIIINFVQLDEDNFKWNDGDDRVNDNFKKQPHHLIYEELLQQGITLGITTRGDGLVTILKYVF